MRLRRTALALVLTGACALSSLALPVRGEAQQQRRPVTLEAKGLFGDELLITDAYSPLLVEAQNNTRRTLRGRVVATVTHWQLPAAKHEVPLDLPPEARRSALMEIFLPEGASINVRYEVDGDPLGTAMASPGYTPSTRGMVVLSDPPRLRGSLLDIEVDQMATAPAWGGPSTPTTVRVPVGVVPFDPATGDPILPTQAVGWATTGLLVASAPDLARVGAAEQRAIVDWVRSGGEVLVFPRTEADLGDPFIQSLVGEVERFESTPTTDQEALVPPGARGVYYRSADRDFRTEAFGGSRRLGFGLVHLATFDGTRPPFVDASQTRATVEAILAHPHTQGVAKPVLPLGRRQDNLSEEWWGGGPTFGALRAALDPNEGYKPALGLVAVVLLLYVVFVGPVNFAFVRKRARPTFALVTTPIAAMLCLAVLLGVGYLGKGTRMRYRAVEIVELQERDALGPARRYTGLFLTRPTAFDLESPDNGVATVVRPSSSELAPVVDHGGERPVLRRVRGRLWETVFVREERIVDMGGGVRFERSGQRLVAVHNEGSETLRGGVVVDTVGSIYRVGDIPPGGQAPVSQVSAMTVDTGGAFYGEEDPALRQLASIMGLPTDHRKTLEGASKVLGGSLSNIHVPVLFAWQEVERGDVAGTFGREVDIRFVRVVPEMERNRIIPVYVDRQQGAYGWDAQGNPIDDLDEPHFDDPLQQQAPEHPMPPDVVAPEGP